MEQRKRFRFRPFVSLLTGFLFVVLVVSGAVLYITPPGRIANWTNWTCWGLTKHQWIAMHICLSTSFLIVSIIHIWLNFKPLMNYFVSKTKNISEFRTEWIASIIICIIIILGALKPFVPFSSLLDLNERLKFSWEEPKQAPPIPHAELLTIEELANRSDIKVDTIIQNLKTAGIEVDVSDVFGDVAEQLNISPNELFEIATGIQPTSPGKHGKSQGGGGFGQKTLEQVCEEIGIETDKAMEALNKAGIQAQSNMRIREIADKNNIHPSQIRHILENL